MSITSLFQFFPYCFKKLFPLLLLGSMMSLAACSSQEDKDDELAETLGEKKLYEMARKKLDSGNYTVAVREYQRLAVHYPFSTYAEQAKIEAIYAYIKSYKYDEAVVAAESFLNQNPQHPNVDYVLYLKALANFYSGQGIFDRYLKKDFSSRDPSNYRQAFIDFAQLLRLFPNSEYGPDAKARMIYLRNILAWHELNVANYYVKRKAWVAAAARARGIVENFQQTPAVSDALAILVQSYLVLGLDDLAQDSLLVLQTNYPDYPTLNQQGEFISQYNPNNRTWLEIATLGVFGRAAPPKFEYSKKM